MRKVIDNFYQCVDGHHQCKATRRDKEDKCSWYCQRTRGHCGAHVDAIGYRWFDKKQNAGQFWDSRKLAE